MSNGKTAGRRPHYRRPAIVDAVYDAMKPYGIEDPPYVNRIEAGRRRFRFGINHLGNCLPLRTDVKRLDADGGLEQVVRRHLEVTGFSVTDVRITSGANRRVCMLLVEVPVV